MSTLLCFHFFFFNDTATTEIYTLSLHDALPISSGRSRWPCWCGNRTGGTGLWPVQVPAQARGLCHQTNDSRMAEMITRRLPVGAEVVPGRGVHVRVWAPVRKAVDVVLADGRSVPLAAEEGGYFAGLVPDAGDGTRYRLRLDGGQMLFPDPASRFQPEGPHGPSQVIDPSGFQWTDAGWKGAPDT